MEGILIEIQNKQVNIICVVHQIKVLTLNQSICFIAFYLGNKMDPISNNKHHFFKTQTNILNSNPLSCRILISVLLNSSYQEALKYKFEQSFHKIFKKRGIACQYNQLKSFSFSNPQITIDTFESCSLNFSAEFNQKVGQKHNLQNNQGERTENTLLKIESYIKQSYFQVKCVFQSFLQGQKQFPIKTNCHQLKYSQQELLANNILPNNKQSFKKHAPIKELYKVLLSYRKSIQFLVKQNAQLYARCLMIPFKIKDNNKKFFPYNINVGNRWEQNQFQQFYQIHSNIYSRQNRKPKKQGIQIVKFVGFLMDGNDDY